MQGWADFLLEVYWKYVIKTLPQLVSISFDYKLREQTKDQSWVDVDFEHYNY